MNAEINLIEKQLQNLNMERKITGWKLKECELPFEELRDAVHIAYGLQTTKLSILDFRNNFKEYPSTKQSFSNESLIAKRLRDAGLLIELFDAVFEEDNNTSASEKIDALQKEFIDKFNALKDELFRKESIMQAEKITLKPELWVKYTEDGNWMLSHPTKTYLIRTIAPGVSENSLTFAYLYNDFWNKLDVASNTVNNFRAATQTEITEHLKTEAIARGYKKDLNVYSPGSTRASKIEENTFQNYYADYESFYMGRTLIYQKGQWAKIHNLQEKIMIESYEVKFVVGCFSDISNSFEKQYTSIDGNKFTKEFWQAAKLISEHTKAKIMVGCSKQFNVSLETINKILDRLK